ncbi:MAG: arginine--tRNA ligase [Spirochaetota bacterium]|jgi:arginyl-tRNA synthetase|nr:arginine--tRNA ligase [Spirochaetota bacterium]
MHDLTEFICERIASLCALAREEVRQALTRPPRLDMGDLAFPCFPLAKQRKKAPPVIARELAEEFAADFAAQGIRCEAAGPYLNFRFDHCMLAGRLLAQALAGSLLSGAGQGRTVVIDYSSPNIAKPFSMGHLRSTSIGNALSHIYAALGWKVARVNHLGDWGTQFGKLIVAFRLWGDRARLANEGIPYLMELYVRVNDEAKARPELDEEARAAFKQLEDGDTAALELWKIFREVSLAEFERIYAILGVAFDSYAGESFYNDRIEAAIAVLERAGLLIRSEGALVVAAGEPDAPEKDAAPPCMIRKSDGASTYAARDLAAIFYRWQEYAFDRLLYVVGSPQALHFKQVFAVLKKLDLAYADRCVHIPFGQVLLNGEMMSTRKGNVIFLEDVIKEAETRALAKMRENSESSDTACEAEIARNLAVSSIIFYDLKNGRIKDVDFNWEEILNPHGETGIYLQYAHARIHGIMRKYDERMSEPSAAIINSPPRVTEEESWPLFDAIARFQEKLALAAEHNEPSVIARFLLDLASAFSAWYRVHRVINEDNPVLSRERMGVVLAVRAVLAQGLRLLGITPLEKM